MLMTRWKTLVVQSIAGKLGVGILMRWDAVAWHRQE